MKTLICTSTSGYKTTYSLPDELVEEWLIAFKEDRKFEFANGDDVIGINGELIVDFRLSEGCIEAYNVLTPIQSDPLDLQPTEEISEHMKELEKAYLSAKNSTVLSTKENTDFTNIDLEQFKNRNFCYLVNCKCGGHYEFYSFSLKNKGACKQCRNIIFTDMIKGMFPSPLSNNDALEMTNTRLVNRIYAIDIINYIKEQYR